MSARVSVERRWSARSALKQRAACLCAIDPAIGGVLVQGRAGVAKTTLARCARRAGCPGRFVELPLGATEERVTGTLASRAALRDGRVEFAPGLLARAHDGVLYVDEVNLLPRRARRSAARCGGERPTTWWSATACRARIAARFVLVGTMNLRRRAAAVRGSV